MLTTPQITVAGNLQDLFGVAQVGSLIVQLCGFGSQVPRVSGTAIIAQTSPLAIVCTAGAYSFKLWGNDVILPAGSFYTVRVVDANGNTVQINAYLFTGTQTIDLSSATPYNPVPVPPAPVPPLGFGVCSPAGPQVSGTLYIAPGPVAMVFYGGVAQRPGIDYTLVTADSFTLNFAILTGETIYALYS